MNKRWFFVHAVMYGLLVAAILVPRTLALDRLVTPDEPTWLTTSANFYHALAHRDLRATYQIEHPGVTTMWIGAMAFLIKDPQYARQGPGQIAWWLEEVGPALQSRGVSPLEVLVTGRFLMALAITLALVVALRSAARLFGFLPAALGFLLIATDPFHIAHSRLLHQDGLLSALMLVSVLALLEYLFRGGSRRALLLSGAAAGLAYLTKSPTVFLVPFAFLLVAFRLAGRRDAERGLTRADWSWAVNTLFLWGAASLVVFVLLWPAMWVSPFDSLWRVGRAMAGYAAGGHEAPVFFNGRVIDGDPGAIFYPVNYAWRATPFVLAGLGLAAAALVAPRAGLLARDQRAPLAALLLFAGLFTLYMTLGAKKFDRYLLPVFLPLDLAAAVGWAALLRRLPARRPSMALAGALVSLLLVFGQFQGAAATYPYFLSYYNPLLGGARKAPEVMMVGWGEGLDQAAQYLKGLPNGQNLRVAAGVWNGTFSYFYPGQVLREPFLTETVPETGWQSLDYLILYINQQQRNRLPRALSASLSQLTPVKVVRLQGLAYVRVYDIRDVPAPGITHRE